MTRPRAALLALTVALTLLAGCAARRPPKTPGPEDAALGILNDCAVWDSAKLDRKLDRRTRSEELPGNAATLLVDGVESYARRAQNAMEADLILVKTFIFTDDEAGRAVANLLISRAQAGATVIVQYDVKGSAGGAGEVIDLVAEAADAPGPPQKGLMRRMARNGVHVVPTNAPKRERGYERWLAARDRTRRDLAELSLMERLLGVSNIGHFDHEKYWITGHRLPEGEIELRAILGGLNIASEYAYGGTPQVDAGTGRGGWRDTDIEVRGPVALEVLERYLDLLETYEVEIPGFDPSVWRVEQRPKGEAAVRFVWNQPAFGNRRSVERLYRTLIDATPKDATIRLQSAYFTPGHGLKDSLEEALERGARLAVVTNSGASVDVPIVTAASRAVYQDLLAVDPSAALYEWRPQPETGRFTLHSKVASFGRCGPVIVGSANLDGLSSERNSESVVMVRDPALRQRFDEMMDADLHERCVDRVTADELGDTPWLLGLYRRMIYSVGWTWLGAR